MPVTPTGPLHQFYNDLKTFLASLDNVQTFLGVVSEPAADALIYDYEAAPGAEASYLTMHSPGHFDWARQDMATGLAGGITRQPVQVGFWRQLDTPADLDSDAHMTFVNQLGAILQECADENGVSGNVFLTSMRLNPDLPKGQLPTYRIPEGYGIGYIAYIEFDWDNT